MHNKAELRKRERELAIRIRNLRLANVLKQEYIADKMGISTSTYSKLENARATIIVKHLWGIAQVLDIPPGILIGV